MRTVTFAGTNRSDNLLHIETDGCTVNIHVGLHDEKGRRVTRVDVNPDDENRGGDGQGVEWNIIRGDADGVTRVLADEPSPFGDT